MFGTTSVSRTEPRKTTGLYVLSAGWEDSSLFLIKRQNNWVQCENTWWVIWKSSPNNVTGPHMTERNHFQKQNFTVLCKNLEANWGGRVHQILFYNLKRQFFFYVTFNFRPESLLKTTKLLNRQVQSSILGRITSVKSSRCHSNGFT